MSRNAFFHESLKLADWKGGKVEGGRSPLCVQGGAPQDSDSDSEQGEPVWPDPFPDALFSVPQQPSLGVVPGEEGELCSAPSREPEKAALVPQSSLAEDHVAGPQEVLPGTPPGEPEELGETSPMSVLPQAEEPLEPHEPNEDILSESSEGAGPVLLFGDDGGEIFISADHEPEVAVPGPRRSTRDRRPPERLEMRLAGPYHTSTRAVAQQAEAAQGCARR